MTPRIVGGKYKVIESNAVFQVGQVIVLDKDFEVPYFIGPNSEGFCSLKRLELMTDDSTRIAELEAEVAALKAQLPKKEWWEQYKVGDKIDLVGLEIVEIDGEEDDSKICVRDETCKITKTWLYFTDKHIRPHQ